MALRAVLELFDPDDWYCATISTPRTILADLQGRPELHVERMQTRRHRHRDRPVHLGCRPLRLLRGDPVAVLTASNDRRAAERAAARSEREQQARDQQVRRDLARAERAKAAVKPPPSCYYCGQPVRKVECWPPVCRACDDLPAGEPL